MENGWATRSNFCPLIEHQDVPDGARNKKEGRKYPEQKYETIENFTAEKTLDV